MNVNFCERQQLAFQKNNISKSDHRKKENDEIVNYCMTMIILHAFFKSGRWFLTFFERLVQLILQRNKFCEFFCSLFPFPVQ